MICSFSFRETEKIWNGFFSKKFPSDIQDRTLRKLCQLDAALNLEDLKHPLGNRLEALKGDRVGEMSIRIKQR